VLDRLFTFHLSGIASPTIQDCLPLAHRVERRLVSTSIFLNQGGKLQLVNSVLSSLPTFYMCSIEVPIDILNQIVGIGGIVCGQEEIVMLKNLPWLLVGRRR
jgi:hypothetical protein